MNLATTNEILFQHYNQNTFNHKQRKQQQKPLSDAYTEYADFRHSLAKSNPRSESVMVRSSKDRKMTPVQYSSVLQQKQKSHSSKMVTIDPPSTSSSIQAEPQSIKFITINQNENISSMNDEAMKAIFPNKLNKSNEFYM